MKPADAAKFGVPWPEAPGEMSGPFVCGSIVVICSDGMVYSLGPTPPMRDVPNRFETVYDDDGFEEEVAVEWRRLSDEEWAEAMTEFRRAEDEYKRTGGRAWRNRGPSITQGEFFTECGGERASGVFAGGKWFWHEMGSG